MRAATEDSAVKGVHKAILRLCQHVCVRVSDRAPSRAHASTVIGIFSSSLSREGVEDLCKFLCRYTQNAKVHYRVFGVELVADTLARHAETGDVCDADTDVCGGLVSEQAVSVFCIYFFC